MQASYLLGKSIRQIAREQHRDPATVSRIVKSAQMDRMVLDMKQKFFGKLLPKALQSVQFVLEEETDGRLGYQVLKDSGVIPNEEETLAEHVSGREAAGQNQENKPGVKRYLPALTDIAYERTKAFNQPLFDPDEPSDEVEIKKLARDLVKKTAKVPEEWLKVPSGCKRCLDALEKVLGRMPRDGGTNRKKTARSTRNRLFRMGSIEIQANSPAKSWHKRVFPAAPELQSSHRRSRV